MTSAALARLHAAAFPNDRSWTAQEFDDLLSSPFVSLIDDTHGFALTRLVAGEAELLTVAVAPDAQGRGIGRRLMIRWLDDITPHAKTAFLEVAADNAVALHLYLSLGFAITATRRGYYHHAGRAAIDALVLSRSLTRGYQADSSAQGRESG